MTNYKELEALAKKISTVDFSNTYLPLLKMRDQFTYLSEISKKSNQFLFSISNSAALANMHLPLLEISLRAQRLSNSMSKFNNSFSKQILMSQIPSISISILKLSQQLQQLSKLQEQFQGSLSKSLLNELVLYAEDSLNFIRDEESVSNAQRNTDSESGNLCLNDIHSKTIEYINSFRFIRSWSAFEIKINNFIKELKVMLPISGAIIFALILPLIMNTLTNLNSQPNSNITIYQDTHVIYKTINNTINLFEDKEQVFKNYRFVSSDILEVRISKNIKSKVIDNVYIGQVVKIIRKCKHWTNIQWIDDFGITKEGWVFTRYLKKFKY